MPNPIFQALGGKNDQPNIAQQFTRFVQSMQGKDPNQMINELVASGRISQSQLDQAQKQARQMETMLSSVRGMFK